MKVHRFKDVGEEIVVDGVRIVLLQRGSRVKIGIASKAKTPIHPQREQKSPETPIDLRGKPRA